MSNPDVYVTIKNESSKKIYYSLVFPDSEGLMTIRPEYYPHDVIEPRDNKIVKLEWFLRYLTGNKGYDILEIRNQSRDVIFTHRPGWDRLLPKLTVVIIDKEDKQVAEIPSIFIKIWNESTSHIYWEVTGPEHTFKGTGKRIDSKESEEVELKYNDGYKNYERLQICNCRKFAIFHYQPRGETVPFINVNDEKDEQVAEFFTL